MQLYLFNTQSGNKEEFIPINHENVTMYVCGPTLYAPPHLGNARPLVVFDVLYRLLTKLYSKVVYVRNVTDIDDKIINKANELHITTNQVVKDNQIIFNEILSKLNIKEPTFQPFATHYIQDMQNMITDLINKQYAYEGAGNVFFATNKFSYYGDLSHKKIAELQNVVDDLTADLKKSPHDFVLWKKAKEHEPSWDSPWGQGRPGWHIECSAMSKALLGEAFDIHGGGIDLVFPHHENERAQSMAACNTNFMAKYWLHNGFINMDNIKMSKSLGNVVSINDILQQYSGRVLRLAILTSQYRHPLNFKIDILEQAKNILIKIDSVLSKVITQDIINELANTKLIDNSFTRALLDDINTPLAIQELQKMVSNFSYNPQKSNLTAIVQALDILGLNFNLSNNVDITFVEALILQREQAKLSKNYIKADEIRNELQKYGIVLEDHKDGSTTWHKINE